MAKNSGGTYTQILYTPTGQKFALMSGCGAASGTYFVPLAAGLQAVYSITNSINALAYHRHADWLGSSRFASTTSGAVYFDRAFAPFGETYAETGAADRSFTGQTQDVVAGSTGIYDFLFRQHSSAQGRWLVPDPAGLAAVDITNPQTWNRYAYVGQ
jgi:RHS repeat-associated protein